MVIGHAPQGFPVFVVIWVLMGFGLSAFLSLNRNAALKRKVWPIASVATGLVFIVFALTMGAPVSALVIMVPFVGLITLLNLRAMKFCDRCGKTIRTRNVFSSTKFCPECGASLER